MSIVATYNSGSQVLKGPSLAHWRMSPRQRNCLIGGMADGSVVVTPLTITQSAAVLRTSPRAVYADRYRHRHMWCSSDLIASGALPTDDEIDFPHPARGLGPRVGSHGGNDLIVDDQQLRRRRHKWRRPLPNSELR